MSEHARARMTLIVLMFIAAVVFATGVNWGLPSRAADAFLFGARPIWSANEIVELAPGWSDPARGADVDANPLVDRDRLTILNATDAQCAEIIRRYRLFSAQPDEMITFRSLAGMQPSTLQLDPKLYQYGGLWIYPVGSLLKIAVNPRSDLSYYLDHPEAFGRFYIVARLYSTAWATVGVFAVFWLTRRMSASLVGASTAALCYIFMPVVVNMAHEAKPHLAGAVLILLAIVAATRFCDTLKLSWWVATGALCGAAAGMVLSAAIAVVIIPTMALIAEISWRQCLRIIVGAGLIAIGVYFGTNPYVGAHLLGDRAILRSNLTNTSTMYQFGNLGDGVNNALFLLREGASLPLALAGLLSMIAISLRQPTRKVALLIAIPSLAVVLPFILLAAGKPGEYARFAILPDISLAVFIGAAIGVFVRREIDRLFVGGLLVVLTAVPGWFYLAGFVRDGSSYPTRLEAAEAIEALRTDGGARTLAIFDEPAPYSLPPVNLFDWQVLLMPRRAQISDAFDLADVVIRPVDELSPGRASIEDHVRMTLNRPPDLFPTRISWARKPYEVWVRREVLDRATGRASSQ